MAPRCVCADHPVTAHVTFSAIKLTYDAAGDPVTTPIPLPPEGSYNLAIAHSVPFDKYVFPPRPGELKPLPPPSCIEVRSDPADPLQPRQIQLPWRDVLYVHTYQQTPGHLRLTFNAWLLGTYDAWDYELQEHTEYVPSTEVTTFQSPVTLTVTPRQVTGGWVVQIEYRELLNRDAVVKTDCIA